jgi:hypothetical protein
VIVVLASVRLLTGLALTIIGAAKRSHDLVSAGLVLMQSCEHVLMGEDKISRFDELPIACTLGATDGVARLARWRALSDARMSVRRTPNELFVLYQSRGDVHEELEALVAAERECCSFAEWEVTRDAEHVELRIRSDAEGLTAIVGAFGGS